MRFILILTVIYVHAKPAFLFQIWKMSSPSDKCLKCGYIIQNRFFPHNFYFPFRSDQFQVLQTALLWCHLWLSLFFCFAFFSQKFCHLLSEMYERREKAYLATCNEDNMLVEDCDTTATAADAEVVASSLHEVRSDSWTQESCWKRWKKDCCWNEGGSKGFVNNWWGLHCVRLRHAWSSWRPLLTRRLSSLFTVRRKLFQTNFLFQL